MREFVTFSVIGSVALVIDLVVLWIALNLFGFGLYSGRLISYFFAATCTWWLNRNFTFRHVGADSALHQWVKFLAANALGGAVNYATYAAFVAWVPSLVPISLKPFIFALPFVATMTGSIVGLALNFISSKYLVFR